MVFRDTLRPLTSSRTLGYVSLLAAIAGAYSMLAIWKENTDFQSMANFPAQLQAAFTVVLGWLLVLRTNAAYARWWEARILWGNLINCSRNLSIKLLELAYPSLEDQSKLVPLIKSFPKQLRDQLRGIQSPPPLGEPLIAPELKGFHAPIATVQSIYRWTSKTFSTRELDGNRLRAIDSELAHLLEICGSCERIAKTPFVRSYRIFVRQCILLYLITFPWGIAHEFGWWTVPATVIVAYFIIGLEIVSEHVEEPFGFDEDDLDLDGMCTTIDRSVDQIFSNHGRP